MSFREVVRWSPTLGKEVRSIQPLNAAPCHYPGEYDQRQ